MQANTWAGHHGRYIRAAYRENTNTMASAGARLVGQYFYSIVHFFFFFDFLDSYERYAPPKVY